METITEEQNKDISKKHCKKFHLCCMHALPLSERDFKILCETLPTKIMLQFYSFSLVEDENRKAKKEESHNPNLKQIKT